MEISSLILTLKYVVNNLNGTYIAYVNCENISSDIINIASSVYKIYNGSNVTTVSAPINDIQPGKIEPAFKISFQGDKLIWELTDLNNNTQSLIISSQNAILLNNYAYIM